MMVQRYLSNVVRFSSAWIFAALTFIPQPCGGRILLNKKACDDGGSERSATNASHSQERIPFRNADADCSERTFLDVLEDTVSSDEDMQYMRYTGGHSDDVFDSTIKNKHDIVLSNADLLSSGSSRQAKPWWKRRAGVLLGGMAVGGFVAAMLSSSPHLQQRVGQEQSLAPFLGPRSSASDLDNLVQAWDHDKGSVKMSDPIPTSCDETPNPVAGKCVWMDQKNDRYRTRSCGEGYHCFLKDNWWGECLQTESGCLAKMTCDPKHPSWICEKFDRNNRLQEGEPYTYHGHKDIKCSGNKVLRKGNHIIFKEFTGGLKFWATVLLDIEGGTKFSCPRVRTLNIVPRFHNWCRKNVQSANGPDKRHTRKCPQDMKCFLKDAHYGECLPDKVACGQKKIVDPNSKWTCEIADQS